MKATTSKPKTLNQILARGRCKQHYGRGGIVTQVERIDGYLDVTVGHRGRTWEKRCTTVDEAIAFLMTTPQAGEAEGWVTC